ncbi:MAG: DUF2029 domain-containing protein, partial [Clostridiales bacterium]|nr:DUF2029 domain-containing protein [Candidatus Equinaster intestinalis]
MEATVKFEKRKLLLYIILFAAATRLAIGIFVTNTFDLYWYRTWIVDIQNGLFNIYSRADQIKLDYPPLFVVLIYPISLLYRIIPPDVFEMADMFFLKLIPIVFDLLSAFLIFKITDDDQNYGIFALALWLLNPSVFFNSTIWGQTDSVLSFLILLTFYFLLKRRPVISTVIFACACMIKYQCAFLAPIFLIAMFDILIEKKLRDFFYCVLAGILTVAAVFVPFSIGAGKPFLIFDVYFGSTGSYPYCTVNAANLYAVLGLNWEPHTTEFVFGISFSIFGYIMLLLGIAFIFFVWFKGKRKSIFLASVFLMQHLFIFMTDMHERYQ